MSVADWLEERGRQKGLDEGLRKGLVEGQRSMLLKLLQARFGALPEAVTTRIQSAEGRQLDLWAERVLTAATLGEVLDEG